MVVSELSVSVQSFPTIILQTKPSHYCEAHKWPIVPAFRCSAMLCCQSDDSGWVCGRLCSLRPLVMEEVNTLSALAGCLDPSTPICVCPCTFDDDVGGGGGGGVNNHESLNIVLKLLITPLYAQVRAARVKKWLSDVFVPSCCAIPPSGILY